MQPSEARARFAAGRVARLATADFSGQPHLVAICFALDRDTVYTAVDQKPKTTMALRRLRNLAMNSRASLLVDHYDDREWSRLWWVRADGTGRELRADEPERARAIELLRDRYEQYRREAPAGPVVAIEVERWVGWAAS